jgi:hypothetical protein
MQEMIDRRRLLQLLGIGAGVVFTSRLAGAAPRPLRFLDGDAARATDEFFFLQLSDSHWGFKGPAVNPEADRTLKQAVATVQKLGAKPGFVVFTGDLTHTTDDPDERRKRMGEFREIVRGLDGTELVYLPGEHDASLDRGKAYVEHFGPLYRSFERDRIHYVALDNVSDPGAIVGDKQIEWLKDDLAKVDAEMPVVVFAHRPLFDLYPDWDWSTRDGKKVVDVLSAHRNVTVFYGHIHQENHTMTGAIAHHSAKSLIFPMPAPGSVPKKAPIPWDAAAPDRGLGFRRVTPRADDAAKRIVELEVGR